MQILVGLGTDNRLEALLAQAPSTDAVGQQGQTQTGDGHAADPASKRWQSPPLRP